MFIASPLIPFTLFFISLLALTTAYLIYRKGMYHIVDKVLFWASLYFFLHGAFVFHIEISYSGGRWQDVLLPFMLGYGPLLFFYINALKNKKPSLGNIFLHFLPFITYFIVFLILLSGLVTYTTTIEQSLNKQLFSLCILSMAAYTIWSVFAGKGVLKAKQKLFLVIFTRILFLFLIMLFVTVLFSTAFVNNPMGVYWYRMMICICLLIGILIIFNYVVTEIFNGQLDFNRTEIKVETENLELPRYERSALSVSQLELYEKKLTLAVREEQLYLDQSLTLTQLAHHLKIPKHHLTQVFSVQVKQSFYQYINSFRIIMACSLLDSPEANGLHLELIAEKSGFNSKVSFNRQFKSVMGCTPSEYRDRLRQ